MVNVIYSVQKHVYDYAIAANGFEPKLQNTSLRTFAPIEGSDKPSHSQRLINIFTGRWWLGVPKLTGILRHRGVQLILASSWAKPAILLAGKGRGGMFLFLLFLHFQACSSFFPDPLFHLLYYLFYIFSPFLWETTQNDPQGLTCR